LNTHTGSSISSSECNGTINQNRQLDRALISSAWKKRMPDDRERFDKVWTLAVNPGALEGEALAAFAKMRALVKANPFLAHPPKSSQSTPPPAYQPQATYAARITNVHPHWTLILVELLSKRAFELGLRAQITFDFSETLTAVKIHCEGSRLSSSEFEQHVDWCIRYINSKLEEERQRKA
jgi:hypothetical protein